MVLVPLFKGYRSDRLNLGWVCWSSKPALISIWYVIYLGLSSY
jgi:hypothetical protein